MGPPRLAPNWFMRKGGIFAGSKGDRESNALSRKNSNTAPWKLLVPLFDTAFTWAPPDEPLSAV